MRGSTEDNHTDSAGLKAIIKTEEDQAELASLRKSEITMYSTCSLFWAEYNEFKLCKLLQNHLRPSKKYFNLDLGFITHLSKLLINDPKLEIVAYHLFIKGDNKS